MTISVDIGKFNATLKHDGVFGHRSKEVELQVQWHSCGVYEVSYYRPRDSVDHCVLVAKNWYPPDTNISFTPEQFDKVTELFPGASKMERTQCYKPFYEDYVTDLGMFDMGCDSLFQAYKDPCPNVEKVYLVKHIFSLGAPTTNTQVLGLTWEDFNKLKDLIENEKDEIFYSGCQVSGNLFTNLTKI